MPVPDTLDLESLRSAGPSGGETLQPEDEGGAGAGAAAAGGAGGSAGCLVGGINCCLRSVTRVWSHSFILISGAPAAAAPEPEPDALIVAALVSMGFSENGSKRAGRPGWGVTLSRNKHLPPCLHPPHFGPKTQPFSPSACNQEHRCGGGHRVGVCPHGGPRPQRPAAAARERRGRRCGRRQCCCR